MKVKNTSSIHAERSFIWNCGFQTLQKEFSHTSFISHFSLRHQVLLQPITSPNIQLYKQMNYYPITPMSSMIPCNCSHMSITCFKSKEIFSINLKSAFTKTNNHLVINKKLIVISHNTTTSTHFQSSAHQLSYRTLCQYNRLKTISFVYAILQLHTHIISIIW